MQYAEKYKPYKKRRRQGQLAVKVLFLIALLAAVVVLVVSIQMSGAFGEGADSPEDEKTDSRIESSQTASNQEPSATVHQNDWKLRLANESHPLPAGFTVETQLLPNGMEIDARAYEPLMQMINDGKEEGLQFVICSAYRSLDLQTQLFEQEMQKYQSRGMTEEQAYQEAKTSVAVPGTSEHSLGLAVDIVALDYQRLDDGYEQTREAVWLKENAYKYGFILRYPKEKSDITGIIFEPWHYRYVGIEAAKEITERGICLEEYLGETE